MRRIDVVYALIYDDHQEKILMVKNIRHNSFDFTLPGGGVEIGETLEQAVIRETKEETGFHIEVDGIVSINEAFVKAKGHHAVFFTFLGRIIGGEMKISCPDEIADIVWMDLPTADQWLKNVPNGVKSTAPYLFEGIR
ncbi:NUDIX hydrolase [Thermoflavimicrobium daqui]|uniref:NUDIX hydrolase n=1 Tax=Thermoflavimicrobium daqui TaxID=2137476 RepID=A0A364K0R7_9BACL|nr:NUDIX hydrolase [Thermoflavimicrobium daqui]RAL21105.1 NUDIX hydrolase [Thermoflavimicrobium daqui]